MIENFLDFVDTYGFVPNGARVYYLNRSQPPLLTLMVKIYVEYTNDTSLLDRALPLLEKELQFWTQNRTVELTSPFPGDKYNLSRYAVLNNQPRPESFREDYITASNTTYHSLNGTEYQVSELNDSQKAEVYAELASGAESGIDFSTKWLRNPLDAVLDTGIPLRSLGLREIIPVELNSVLYASEIAIANFHLERGNKTAYKHYQSLANHRLNGMYDLMFNETEFRYFDYNTSLGAQNVIGWTGSAANLTRGVRFYPQQFWPFWLGAIPETLATPEAVQVVFQPVAELLDRNAGAIGASNLESGHTRLQTVLTNRPTVGCTQCLAPTPLRLNARPPAPYHSNRILQHNNHSQPAKLQSRLRTRATISRLGILHMALHRRCNPQCPPRSAR